MAFGNFPESVRLDDPRAPWNEGPADTTDYCARCNAETTHHLVDGEVRCEWDRLHRAADVGGSYDVIYDALLMARTHPKLDLAELAMRASGEIEGDA